MLFEVLIYDVESGDMAGASRNSVKGGGSAWWNGMVAVGRRAYALPAKFLGFLTLEIPNVRAESAFS